MKNRELKDTIRDLFFATRIISVLITVSVAGPAHTEPATDGNTISEALITQTILKADIAGQMNPNGLKLKTDYFKKWIQETGNDDSPARYIQTGFGLAVSPAFAKASICGEWQLIFLNLHIGYDLYRFFGANTGLLSFPDKHAKFGDHEVDDLKGTEETATAHRILFQPALYAKAGPVIIINQTNLAYYRFNGRGPYFLELEYDMLLKNGDYLFNNLTQLLVPVWKGIGASVLYLGPYFEITRARDAGLIRQRAGGQIYWVITKSKWGISRPRVYSQAGWNIQDRNRKGEICFALGLGADFDL